MSASFTYLLNPFSRELLRAVITRIEESLDRRPRQCSIIYSNPRLEDEFIKRGFTRVPCGSLYRSRGNAWGPRLFEGGVLRRTLGGMSTRRGSERRQA